jgi:N-acetyl-anhydromuramyl-L-alanine amidase AmpD
MRIRFFILLNLAVFVVLSASWIIAAGPDIKEELITWGHKKYEGKRTIDAVIVHSTYYADSPDSFSVAGVLKQFRQYDVSAHYLIDRTGTIHRLVKENDISYHAGVSSLPDGRTNVNSTSIGIEVIITKFSPPAEVQYTALAALVKDIKRRHSIKYIKRHSDIAPERKTDPWNFDWKKWNEMLDKE